MALDSTVAAPIGPQPDSQLRRVAAAMAGSLLEHRVYLLIILLFWAACPIVGRLAGASEVIKINAHAEIFTVLVTLFTLTIVLGHALWVAFLVRPEGSLFKAIGQDFRRRFLIAPRLFGFLIVAAPAPMFMSVFGSYKRMIPYINPYDWDPTFMAWDKALHGGYHPWELLQPLLGTPAVTSGINFFYNIWILVLFFTFIWQAWSRHDPALRRQYLVSFLLCWIVIGTILATLLASVGPCYYGRVTGLEDPFAPLMAYLYEVRDQHGYAVWALKVQETLWEVYQTGGTNFGAGISAMPSLHVATSVLMALLGWRTHRLMGIAYTVFAAIIVVGSVHLGWHYAIDGYVSIAVAIAIWWGVGRFLPAFRTRSDAEDAATAAAHLPRPSAAPARTS